MNDEYLRVAVDAAQNASSIIMNALDKPRAYSHKGMMDLVTETDKASEQTIIEQIRRQFPDHSILAEESGQDTIQSDYQWIIDPLDGTTNFVHGYPCFAVSIALHNQGIPLIGVVSELPAGHLYIAMRGKGASLNDTSIKVSSIEKLSKSLLVTGFGYEHGEKWQRNMDLFKHFTDITQGVRRLGAASVDLCHVACGRVDGFWEYDLHPWDTAAGILIIQEAGGMVTGMDGNPFSIYQDHVLCTNGYLHQEMLRELGS